MGSLEEQALGPIQAGGEMALPLDKMLARLKEIPDYKPLFDAAFPGQEISAKNVARAIATFERTVVSARAPFDAWVEGDDKAISENAKRGFVVFNNKGQCSLCHSSWRFSDDSFHDIGLPDGDIGRGAFLPNVPKVQHAFKTPGLREISLRGPYMHNGSIATLEAIVEHYDSGGVPRESRSELIRPLDLTREEKARLGGLFAYAYWRHRCNDCAGVAAMTKEIEMKGFKLIAAFVAGGAVAVLAAAAYGAQHTITEKGKVFSESEITIKTGDTIVFVNDDVVAHNVLSTAPENSFNLGLLAPGTSTPVTFNTAARFRSFARFIRR